MHGELTLRHFDPKLWSHNACVLRSGLEFYNLPWHECPSSLEMTIINPCHSRCGTLKNLHCSMAMRAEHSSKLEITNLSPVIVTSPYVWKILEMEENSQQTTNKQTNKHIFCKHATGDSSTATCSAICVSVGFWEMIIINECPVVTVDMARKKPSLLKCRSLVKICSLSPVMLMSQYEWTFFEWDQKPQTNKKISSILVVFNTANIDSLRLFRRLSNPKNDLHRPYA